MGAKSLYSAVVAMLLLFFVVVLSGCGGKRDYTPKPKAYMRITLPEASYHLLDTAALPFTFELHDSAQVVIKKSNATDHWADIIYPSQRGVVFLSHKRMASVKELTKMTSDSYKMIESHYSVASGVDEQAYTDDVNHVYGTTYRLAGRKVASTYQFWATDSAHNFLHGVFYLDRTPNNDSLRPVLDYIQHDLDHLLETLRWR